MGGVRQFLLSIIMRVRELNRCMGHNERTKVPLRPKNPQNSMLTRNFERIWWVFSQIRAKQEPWLMLELHGIINKMFL